MKLQPTSSDSGRSCSMQCIFAISFQTAEPLRKSFYNLVQTPTAMCPSWVSGLCHSAHGREHLLESQGILAGCCPACRSEHWVPFSLPSCLWPEAVSRQTGGLSEGATTPRSRGGQEEKEEEEEGCPAGKQHCSARGPDTGPAASFRSLELHLDSPKQQGKAAFIAMLKK